MATRKKLTSTIALIEPDKITVHGLDLGRDLLGKINLGDMAFLQLKKRTPTPQESTVFNAITVTLAEYGMTPSAIVSRMTFSGAPESIPAAIGAGLCAMGGGLAGAMERAARMLQEALPDPKASADLDKLARGVVDSHAQSRRIPGCGVPFHTPVDPRTAPLFEIARTNGFSGPYVTLMQLIAKRAEETFGRPQPISAPGAIGAIACELGLPWQIMRGVLAIGRAVGVVGHILEEMHDPLSREIQTRAQEETSASLRGA